MKKKKLYWKLLLPIAPYVIGLFGLISLIGGASGASVPLEPPATKEKAYEYQCVAAELGVPWDLVLLTDAIHAQEKGENGVEDSNPLMTSLEFCIIQETVEQYVVERKKDKDGKVTSTGKWQYSHTNYYEAAEEILSYLGKKKETFDYDGASLLISKMNKTAEEKSTSSLRYLVAMVVNSDYRKVLEEYIGLKEEDIERVLDLHESGYLAELYGIEGGSGDYEGELPPVVVGNVTREDLAKVAVSLLNHPYQLGAKYWKKGYPTGPLDCSGFVDWVYIQCFGKAVSAGTVPEGIPVSGTAMQFYACSKITEGELVVGDLGFLQDPALLGGKINHVGIYIGKIKGKNAFVHCAGRYYGYADRPTGRVGISVSGESNNINNVTGTTFSPAMKGCTFRYFRRPNFVFQNDSKKSRNGEGL